MNTDPYQPPSPEENDDPVAKEEPKTKGSLTWGVIGIIIGCLCTFGSISGFAKNGFGVGAAGLMLNLAFGLFMLIGGASNLMQYFGREKAASDA